MTTPEEEPTPVAYKDLSPELKVKLLEHFNAAAEARSKQWDEEGAMERILGREIAIDFQDWAEAGGGLEEEDLLSAIEE